MDSVRQKKAQKILLFQPRDVLSGYPPDLAHLECRNFFRPQYAVDRLWIDPEYSGQLIDGEKIIFHSSSLLSISFCPNTKNQSIYDRPVFSGYLTPPQ